MENASIAVKEVEEKGEEMIERSELSKLKQMRANLEAQLKHDTGFSGAVRNKLDKPETRAAYADYMKWMDSKIAVLEADVKLAA
jgi:hypothetical protein